MIKIIIPFPPTQNTLYKNAGRGRAKSARYKTWIRAATNDVVTQLMLCRVKKLTGPVDVKISVVRPDERKRDIDNLIKAPLDLLVRTGMIDDDRNVQSVTVAWVDMPGAGALVEVRDHE